MWSREGKGCAQTNNPLGQTREKIKAACDEEGFTETEYAESLEEAVEKASEFAKEGDAVLLSPACASWGMFKNYEERGDLFRELVLKMK